MPDITVGKSAQFKVDNAASWDAARDATSGTASTPATNEQIKLATGTGKYDLYRGAIAFDTSGITITPASAVLKLYGQGNFFGNNIRIVKGNQAATGDFDTDYVDGDFDQIVFGTPYSDEYAVSSGTWTRSDFNEITLNAAALADIASLDSFELWVVAESDYDDVEPSAATYSGPGWEGFNAGEGSAQYPRITYVAGPEPTSLTVTTAPDDATTGGVFGTQPVVSLLDDDEDVMTTDSSSTITAAIQTGTGTLLGTTTVTMSSGVGTFTNLRIDEAGDFTLRFSTNAGSFTVDSDSFTVASAISTFPQSEAAESIGDDYTVNTFSNDVLSAQHERTGSAQVPFSLGVQGPRHLRGRTTAYAPSLGSKTKK
jgi:hypothetical protein